MTQDKHVYAVQNIISRGQVSGDKDFSNRFIAHLLKLNRAVLLQRKLDKNRYLNSMTMQKICMPLLPAQFADCPGCDLPITDCYFLKGIAVLPNALISKHGISYTVRTIAGDIIDPISITNNKYMKYSETQVQTKG